MLRTNILWNIWTQRCRHNFSDEKFNLSSALFSAWQTTIQIGMAAWYEVKKFRNVRGQRKQSQLEESFTNTWTKGSIFSVKGHNIIHWRFTPDETFLPKDMAREAARLRESRRRRGHQVGTQDSGIPDSQAGYPETTTQGENSVRGDEERDVDIRHLRGENSQIPTAEGNNSDCEERESRHLAEIAALLELADLV